MHSLFYLNPIRALHDYWRESSPEAHIAIGTAGFGAWWQRVDWAAVLAFSVFAIGTVVGMGMQLYKQWRLISLELEEKKRELAAHRTPPAEAIPG